MTIVSFINKLYLYFKLSILFWFHLIKGAVVLSLLPALIALFETADTLRRVDDDQVGTIYRESFKKADVHKFKSFGFVFLFSTLTASILATRLEGVEVSPLITGIFIYLVVMELVILVYTAWFLFKDQATFRQTLIKSFVVSIQKIPITVSLIVLIVLAAYVGAWNLVLMIFCVPSFWAFIVREIFQFFFYPVPKAPKKKS